MAVAVGTTAYGYGATQCSGTGLQWTKEDVDAALEGDVAAALFDDEGAAEIASIITGLRETGFAQKRLGQILNPQRRFADWRVGEAIAESYLVCHRSCYFPWPPNRDKRNIRASLPGADLIGFSTDAAGNCLVFGEVKTSGQSKYPPDVVHGSGGLSRQLKDLRDCKSLRDDLFRYLAYRAVGASWRPRFETASRRYIQESAVRIYGFLVRDVPPQVRDLRSTVERLGQDRPDGTVIELLALYLPDGYISGMGRAVGATRSGGAA